MAKSHIEGLRTSFTRDEYTSAAVFAQEMSDIYEQRWCYVGRLPFVTAMGSYARTSMCASTVVRNYVIRRVPVTAQQLPARTILGVTRSMENLLVQFTTIRNPLTAMAFHFHQ